MQFIEDDRPLMSLTLPGSHNSSTYTTKDYLGPVSSYVCCQEKTITKQLYLGVRFLDVRVSGYRAGGNRHELWCSHTLLTIRVTHMMDEVKQFLRKSPSETVVIVLKPDFS